MHRSESLDWLLNYRAVLVANAIRAVSDAPFAMRTPYAAAKARIWLNVPVDSREWRAAAVAAGAVSAD